MLIGRVLVGRRVRHASWLYTRVRGTPPGEPKIPGPNNGGYDELVSQTNGRENLPRWRAENNGVYFGAVTRNSGVYSLLRMLIGRVLVVRRASLASVFENVACVVENIWGRCERI